ncbi:hypothetical protein QFC20_007809 [Naganishia adeliensis]|uniref:Uncharacterized protein n=1 Tax=Naganishia adeliensis TaxID=92952 RepID=A0ACC2UV11_9TREE|nr:hypothetical protein QFC20_007809 [Naganishia adeliensis]
MADNQHSSRSSDLSDPPPETPTNRSSSTRTGRDTILSAPNPDRIVRLPDEVPHRESSTELLQQLIRQMQGQAETHAQQQAEMQTQLQTQFEAQQRQQREFEANMGALVLTRPASPARIPPDVRESARIPAQVGEDLGDLPVRDEEQVDNIGLATDCLPSASPRENQNSQRMNSANYSGRQQTYQYGYQGSTQVVTQVTKVKATDLPKFNGLDNEDVEVWIEQLSAIFEANRVPNAEIIGHIALVLKGNASMFQKANYDTDKKREWKRREPRTNEKMSDYFDSKVYLQTFVYDKGTSDRERILDLMDGLPKYMVPILKGSINPLTTLLDFRRILLDFEDGLRFGNAWKDKTTTSSFPQSSRSTSDFKARPTDAKPRDATKPPRPCSCGGMHWFRDCPKKTSKSNNVSSFKTNPNRILINRSKWPQSNASQDKFGSQNRDFRKEARINSVRFEETDTAEQVTLGDSLPEQDNDGYDHLHALARNEEQDQLYASTCNISSTNASPLQHRHSDKVPTFAVARIGNKEGTAHEVCIDTGSAISLIDSQYLKKNFPTVKINAASTIVLKGVGNNHTHGWINADIHFINEEQGHTSIIGVFHVVASLATKIIIGNDILAEEGAIIDLKQGTCSFRSSPGVVKVISLRPKTNTVPHTPSARVQQVYTIKPGFQARIPVTLTAQPPTSLYLLSPVQLSDDIQVSRSIGVTQASTHYAHVMNVGKNIVKIPADVVLATVMAVSDSSEQVAGANNAGRESLEDLEAFEEACRAGKWSLWQSLIASPLLRELAQAMYSCYSRQGFRYVLKWKTKGS